MSSSPALVVADELLALLLGEILKPLPDRLSACRRPKDGQRDALLFIRRVIAYHY